MSGINWGDVPTWVGAVFAAAAAGAAVWTLKSQRDQIGEQRDFIAEQRALIAEQTSTLALERAELVHAAHERRRAQAEAIVWSTEGWLSVLTNHSGAPITDLRFGHPSGPVTAALLHDSHRVLGFEAAEQPYPVLGSGRKIGCQKPEGASTDPVTVTFTDDAGVR
ncbi:hypothetical protein [Streptomyces sp. NPDC054834]